MNNSLSSWSTAHQEQLFATIERAKQMDAPFAVFDADNTIWQHDITEALMVWLEHRKIIDLEDVHPLLLPIPVLDGESVYGYYDRLGHTLGHSSSYLWSAQIFDGLSLSRIQSEMMAMMASNEPLYALCVNDGVMIQREIPIPKIFAPQKELITTLQDNGMQVWIVSASLEELVRMVASNPLYGINIPAEQVLGVNMLVEAVDGSVWASAQHREAGLVGNAYFHEERLQGVLTHHLYAPGTWYAGKVAAIQEWIHPIKRPMLVAGDSPNDFYMQFYANAEQGGTRLRIHTNEAHKNKLQDEKHKRASVQNINFDPELGWLEVSFSANCVVQ